MHKNNKKSVIYMYKGVSNSNIDMEEVAIEILRQEFSFTYQGCLILYIRKKKDYLQKIM